MSNNYTKNGIHLVTKYYENVYTAWSQHNMDKILVSFSVGCILFDKITFM